MAAIPLIETETKQICPACGKEHSGKFEHKINGETHKGVCFSCIKKERYKIYINKPGNLTHRKQTSKKYFAIPEKAKKHIATMKIYHERTRQERVIRDGNKRGLGSENFINKPFRGSAAHHMTITTIVYIPAWIHIELQHQHKFPDTLDVINKWSEKWLKFTQKHVEKSLQWKLVKFYRMFVTNVYN